MFSWFWLQNNRKTEFLPIIWTPPVQLLWHNLVQVVGVFISTWMSIILSASASVVTRWLLGDRRANVYTKRALVQGMKMSMYRIPPSMKCILEISYYLYKASMKVHIHDIIANWLEGQTIKYTNFPAKYMNSRSKLHWTIHVVLCLVSVTWKNHQGIGIPELRDHAERHSAFNSSSMWILILFDFYDILGVFFPLM